MEQNLTRIFTLFGGLALFFIRHGCAQPQSGNSGRQPPESLLAAVTGSPVRGVLAGLRSRRCCKAARQSR